VFIAIADVDVTVIYVVTVVMLISVVIGAAVVAFVTSLVQHYGVQW
jgi:hypothetical protein